MNDVANLLEKLFLDPLLFLFLLTRVQNGV